MKKINIYMIILLTLSLMSFSVAKNSSITRLKEIEGYLYNLPRYYKTNQYFYYNQNRLDSVISVLTENRHNDWSTKEAYKYKYHSNTVEVYKEGTYFSTSTKDYSYEFDAKGRLSRFIIYGKDKILRNESYTYEKNNSSIKVRAIERYEMDTVENHKETVYFLSSSHNIDSTYEYFLDDKNIPVLFHIRIYKYDNYLNPRKNLLFGSIDEYYFNSNNVISCQYLNAQHKVNGNDINNINNNKYDSKRRLKRTFDDDIYESDSTVTIYHYLNNPD